MFDKMKFTNKNEDENVGLKPNLPLLLIIILFLVIFFMFIFNKNEINIEEIANIAPQIKNPIFKQLDIRNKSYILITDKAQNNITQVLDINTGKSNILPKKGEHQEFLYIAYPYKGLVSINFAQSANPNIELFNLKDKKWNKLETKVSIDKAQDATSSASIIYDNQSNPLLFAWDSKLGNTNTLQIIDIINDKLIQKIPFNYYSGSMLTLDNRNIYYLTNKTDEAIDGNIVNISDKQIKILPILTDSTQAYFVPKLKDYSFLNTASERTPAFLAVDYKNNTIVEYELNNDINTPVKTNNIELPKKYKNYKIINAIPQSLYGLILVLKNDKKQLLVKFDIFHKVYKENQNHRFKYIANLNKDIDLTNALYVEYKNKTGIMYTKDNKIMLLTLDKKEI